MAIELRRGCGYRKVGGLYLVGEGLSIVCERLPFNLHICPVCNEGIRVTRSYRWIDGSRFLGKNCEKNCSCHSINCPICNSNDIGKCLVMGVGDKFYTPEKFIKEAQSMGVSKRIQAIPQGFEMCKTWILLTHSKAGTILENDEVKSVPAVFYAFKPQRIEKLMKKSDINEEIKKDFDKKGITIIEVPDDDKDHQGNVYSDLKKRKSEEQKELI